LIGLQEVVSTIAYGGNILINVGPTADGRISNVFQDRLLDMGEWLGVNGEAMYVYRVLLFVLLPVSFMP